MERYIQYETIYVRSLIEAGIIPATLVRKIQDRILGAVDPPPEPILFHLENPECVWTGEPPKMVEFDTSSRSPRTRVYPLIFVHGMQYVRKKEDAYKFYEEFEKATRLFKGERDPDSDEYDVYILSYDSDLTNETNLLIRRALEAELATNVEDDSPLLYLAILWRELVNRARYAGEKCLTPLFHSIFRLDEQKSKSGYIISHSLGNEAVAFAANKYYSGRENTYIPICKSWWCMAAAIPADAFTNTGDYGVTPKISNDTIVWFSRTDEVLSLLYPMGNTAPSGEPMLALGVTGALQHQYPLTNLDVTLCTDITHEVGNGYFRKLSKNIRWRLGIDMWPGRLCELNIPSRRD